MFDEDCVMDEEKAETENVKFVQDVINAKCHSLLEPASTASIDTCIIKANKTLKMLNQVNEMNQVNETITPP